jgi:hypothetical protein
MPGHTSAVSSSHQNKLLISNKHMLGNEWIFILIRRIVHFIYINGCAKEGSKRIKDGKNKKRRDKGNNGSEREAGHYRQHREEKTTMIWPRQEDARGEITKTNYGMDTMGEKGKRTPKEKVDGKSTSSHDNKKLRTRSMEKRRGTAFGLRKAATVVKNTG